MEIEERRCDVTAADVSTLRAREALRCEALVARDYAALAQLLDSALVHTHSTGEVYDKEAYLRHVRGPVRCLAIERGDLDVHVYGDVALMRGTLTNTIQPPVPVAAAKVQTQVLQVWLRRENEWRLLALQATRVLPPEALPQ